MARTIVHKMLVRMAPRLLVPVAVTLALLLVGCTSEKFRTGRQVTVGQGETIVHDLYAAAGSVDIRGTIKGDLVAAGGVVDVTGSVDGDVVAAGGSVNLNGNVGGDIFVSGGDVDITGSVSDHVRAAGGSVRVDAVVGDDVIAGGGSVTLGSGASVAGDLIVGAGSAKVDGVVHGDALLGVEKATIGGTVKGNVEMIGDRLTLESTARLEGNLTYTSERELTMETGAQVLGETVRIVPTTRLLWFIEVKSSGPVRTVEWVITRVQWFLGILIVALLVLWLAPVTLRAARDTIVDSPWRTLGLGALLLIAVPIAVAFVAFFALLVGGFAAVPVVAVPVTAYAALLMLASPVIALLLGHYALRLASRGSPPAWQSITSGAIILALIGAIPVLNVIVFVLALLFGFGAWLLVAYRCYTQARAEERV